VRFPSGETPLEPAAGTACATGFMGSFDLQQWTRIGAMNRFDVAPAGCKMCFYKFLACNQMTKL
jgi:hypothetical protein